MTTFQDGPAKGEVLSLHRSPMFLRVVECLGVWDALDQLEDAPRREETIYAYRLANEPSRMFVRMARGCQSVPRAEYRLCEHQPADEVMRDRDKWREWCKRQTGRSV